MCNLPSWLLHAKYSRKFMSRMGIEGIDPRVIDALVDEPSSILPVLKERVSRENRLLSLILYREEVRPMEPIAVHDWGAWTRYPQPAIEALRRVAEILYGREGRLLVDLHLSLDYVWWREVGRREFLHWAGKLDISREVVDFILEELEELKRLRRSWRR